MIIYLLILQLMIYLDTILVYYGTIYSYYLVNDILVCVSVSAVKQAVIWPGIVRRHGTESEGVYQMEDDRIRD